LKKLQPEISSVLRDNIWNNTFPAGLIVPGDIIALRVGNRVPADAKIVELKTTTFNTDEGE
jgi:Ca2+-transporting ATPase